MDTSSPTARNAKALAYRIGRVPTHYSTHRLERGQPFYRTGAYYPVYATPQFKAQVIYTRNVKSNQLPGTTQTNSSVNYPKTAK